ncbi:MAG: Rrf2 family transcriptional regulator [Rhizobiales bacterium TMED83]|jgi:Rrf2 family iron-sulfur cluster assembly transcriptional regulator|nr:Rrf2 family transcriptional regulator [Rhodobiaceae bacterium]RPF92494.1 MAG: Rrf2 family transcriptional regulator [Rhizobiales bacterium TMED83]HCD17400.1 Rrf2 family transcriptional regulator [Rhodobiaceae bacterium]
MKLSTRGRYAVMAMSDLAVQARLDAKRPISLAEIGAREGISLSYLEQIFARLRRAGLVTSIRGAQGGYCLSAAASAIGIGDIIRAVDEPIEVTRCRLSQGGCQSQNARCLTHDLWAGLGRQIYDYLDSVSLEDVVLRKPLSAQPTPVPQSRSAGDSV